MLLLSQSQVIFLNYEKCQQKKYNFIPLVFFSPYFVSKQSKENSKEAIKGRK